MGRPKTYDEDLRNRLLDEATKVLVSDGYRTVSLRKISSRAGTSTNAVYTLFGSKEALLAEAILNSFDTYFNPIAQTNNDLTAEQELLDLSHGIRDLALNAPNMFNGAFEAMIEARQDGSLTDRINPDVKKLDEKLFDPIDAVCTKIAVEHPSEDLDANRMAMTIWAAIHGFVVLETAGLFKADSNASDIAFDEMMTALYIGWTSPDMPTVHDRMTVSLK